MTKDKETVLRIIELQAENVKRIKAVRLKPDRTLVRIEGRNAQGKTSVLDAIAAALGGGKWQPDLPIRKGETRASIKLNLGALIVERRWTAKGGTVLEVTAANGERQATPQTILDTLVGDLTFDPLAFVRMKPKDQADTLRRLAGLDFSELDAERERLYAERTVTNREARTAMARRGDMPPKPPSDKPTDIRALADKQQAAIAYNRTVSDANDAMERAEQMKADAKRAEDAAHKAFLDAETQANDARERARGMKLREIADLGADIAEAEARNNAIIERHDWEERERDAKAAQTAADVLDDRIEAIDEDKGRRLRDAKFPLDALGLDINGPTLNDIPFSQASSAEQLRTGVAIGLAEKRQARIMLIRDGSLLDGDGLKDLYAIAEEFDAQVFVERVAEVASPSAVFIEDGEIVEDSQ